MSPLRRGFRRACTLVVCTGLAVALTACDSGGSSKSDAGTTTSTRKRRPHRTTTTSSSTASTSSTTGSIGTPGATGTPGTTAPTLPPTTAPASTGTCGAQAAGIASVVTGGDVAGVPLDSYTIADCRLAPSSPIWGAVTLAPKPGQAVPPVTVVVELLGSIWTLHSYAAGATGCDVPAPVPAELRLGC